MSNEARNEELTALSLRTVGKDWVEDINYGGSPSAHSSHATLIAELAAERAKVKKLREALHMIGYEPIGPTDATDSQVLTNVVVIARAALAETAE